MGRKKKINHPIDVEVKPTHAEFIVSKADIRGRKIPSIKQPLLQVWVNGRHRADFWFRDIAEAFAKQYANEVSWDKIADSSTHYTHGEEVEKAAPKVNPFKAPIPLKRGRGRPRKNPV